MPPQPTVLLLHNTPTGTHYDWLIGMPIPRPGATPGVTPPGEDGLWAARVAKPSRHWPSLGGFDLHPLPLHRRLYLTYQGPITGRRGTVRRVDQGRVIPRLWSDRRIVLDALMRQFSGRLHLRYLSRQCWHAQVLPLPKGLAWTVWSG